jgi:hypothetical protein
MRTIQSSVKYLISELWRVDLPYLYSYMSLVGVALLIICTPLGFARQFSVISDWLVDNQANTKRFEVLSPVTCESTVQLFKYKAYAVTSIHENHSILRIRQLKAAQMFQSTKQQTSTFLSYIKYPMGMITVFIFTVRHLRIFQSYAVQVITLLFVCDNTIRLTFGRQRDTITNMTTTITTASSLIHLFIIW